MKNKQIAQKQIVDSAIKRKSCSKMCRSFCYKNDQYMGNKQIEQTVALKWVDYSVVKMTNV
jgi:hypothetical protein